MDTGKERAEVPATWDTPLHTAIETVYSHLSNCTVIYHPDRHDSGEFIIAEDAVAVDTYDVR